MLTASQCYQLWSS